MATKKAAKKAGAKKPAKSKAKQHEAEPAAGGARQLISANKVRDLVKHYDICKARSAEATGSLGELTRDYVDQGLNSVAFGIANRIRRQAQRDPVKAAITLEDFKYYLYECMGIEKMLGKSMFSDAKPQTKPKRSRKAEAATNGAGEPDHTDQDTGTDMSQVLAAADAEEEGVTLN